MFVTIFYTDACRPFHSHRHNGQAVLLSRRRRRRRTFVDVYFMSL
jgi:hypothetical protein